MARIMWHQFGTTVRLEPDEAILTIDPYLSISEEIFYFHIAGREQLIDSTLLLLSFTTPSLP